MEKKRFDYSDWWKDELPSVKLFAEPYGGYQYYSLPTITGGLDIPQKVVEDAGKLVAGAKVVFDEYKVGYIQGFNGRQGEQVCNVIGHYGSATGYRDEISFIMNHDEILRMHCDAPGCACNYDKYDYYRGSLKYKKPCKHMVALIKLMYEYQKTHVVGDATNAMGQNMLSYFRGLHAGDEARKDESLQNAQPVELQPRLIMQNGRLTLSFKIGTDKLYILKNMSEFVHQLEEGKMLKLGKSKEINLATSVFTQRAERYIEFIRREVNQEHDRQHNLEDRAGRWFYASLQSESMTGSMDLYGARLDDFFEMCMGEPVPYADKDNGLKELPYQLLEGSISFRLELNPEYGDGQFQAVSVRGVIPNVISGSHHKYYVDDARCSICRLDEKSMERLKPLSRMATGDLIDIRIGRGNLSEFYYRILPRLRECAAIDDKTGDAVREFLPEDVEFKFYLDADNNKFFCRPSAVYETGEYPVLDMFHGNVMLDVFRDRLRETEAGQLAMKYFPAVVDMDEGETLVSTGDDDDAYRILNEGVPALMELGEIKCTDSFNSRGIRRNVKVSVGVSVKSRIMELDISGENLSPRELLDILNSYRLKKKYHRLKNGDFVDITDESIAELSDMMEAMRISPKEFVSGKMHLPLYRAMYLDKMLESCQDIYANRDHHFRNLVKNFKTVADSDFEPPAQLDGVLRNYQKYGHKWLRFLGENNFGGILADDMGLGKTAQVISVLLSVKDEADKPSLVVCPASLVYNWQSEFEKFAPELETIVIAGSQAQRIEQLHSVVAMKDRAEVAEAVEGVLKKKDRAEVAKAGGASGNKVLITSYDLLKRDIAEYEDIEFEYQVIDEAQYIKTHTTAAAKSVKVIHAAHKLALTGTPIENRLSELWSIFDYLMPGFLYGYDVFKKELETPIVKQGDETATARLKRMVSPFILRRLKKDVLKDLPDKLEKLQYARMEDEQLKLYDAQVAHMKDMLGKQDEESFKKNKIQILAELMHIRQICCDPSLMFSNYRGESSKRLACMDLIESAIEGEHKMLVFSQFTTMLDLLANELDKRGISYYTITGATPKEKRIELVNDFNSNDVPVFLISLKAGGTGLNLTGADVVIHYDPWWNVAAQNQATDRAHRIGQTKAVTVYRLIVKNSIEEKIVKLQQDKADLADSILGGENGNVVNMTREDLMELLG